MFRRDLFSAPALVAGLVIFCAEPALANADTIAHHVDILNKLQTLEQEVQELRGQLEVQSHQLALLVQQPEASPVAQAVPVAEVTPPATPTAPTANAPSEQVSYLNAYELINSKQFSAALPAMQAFVSQYPHSGFAANAYYWIGELFLIEKNYPEAIRHFELVLNNYPASSKSSASLLKIGYALAETGKLSDAKHQLQAVIKNYPDTNAAQLAMAKLETLHLQ